MLHLLPIRLQLTCWTLSLYVWSVFFFYFYVRWRVSLTHPYRQNTIACSFNRAIIDRQVEQVIAMTATLQKLMNIPTIPIIAYSSQQLSRVFASEPLPNQTWLSPELTTPPSFLTSYTASASWYPCSPSSPHTRLYHHDISSPLSICSQSLQTPSPPDQFASWHQRHQYNLRSQHLPYPKRSISLHEYSSKFELPRYWLCDEILSR